MNLDELAEWMRPHMEAAKEALHQSKWRVGQSEDDLLAPIVVAVIRSVAEEWGIVHSNR